MIIEKIEIQNFRSYYKENSFQFTDGLNLIIGGNGDGKTTFYEALEWLFDTTEKIKQDSKLISKKRSEELTSGKTDVVRVAMTYEHRHVKKVIEKQFKFTISTDNTISMSSYEYNLFEGNGVERLWKRGEYFDRDLSPDIRQYIMFKGETNLDVFQKSTALKMLLETFSEIKDFDAYSAFMEFAVNESNDARQKAQSRDKEQERKVKKHEKTLEEEKTILEEIERELQEKSAEANNFETLLKNLERTKEASKLLKAVNSRIESLSKKREEKAKEIHEDYTINLLDNMWILMGFEPIAAEYSAIVSKYDRLRRKLDQDHVREETVNKVIQKVQRDDFVPLPAHIPGPKIMQEMLDEEICKFCGRPAKMHTLEWNFMLQRLEDYKESLKLEDSTEDTIEPLFINDYIVQLQKRDTVLCDNLSLITKMNHQIDEVIAINNRLHNEINKYDANINLEYEQKKRILAQSEGLTEDQLLSNFENISNWTNGQRDAKERISLLKSQRSEHLAIKEEAEAQIVKCAKGTTAELYARIWEILCQMSKAFGEAKEYNKMSLLHLIEDEANYFLENLNIDDFKGTIRILPKGKDEAEAILMNNDDTRIFTPNTALRTTYLMSILFAIGKIASDKKESPFPLIFDAPTSSFTDKKESEFFNVIGKLNKQVIIVTKSFLKDTGNGDMILDESRVRQINAKVYRIEKKKPFDDRKLGTIQTLTTPIK